MPLKKMVHVRTDDGHKQAEGEERGDCSRLVHLGEL